MGVGNVVFEPAGGTDVVQSQPIAAVLPARARHAVPPADQFPVTTTQALICVPHLRALPCMRQTRMRSIDAKALGQLMHARLRRFPTQRTILNKSFAHPMVFAHVAAARRTTHVQTQRAPDQHRSSAAGFAIPDAEAARVATTLSRRQQRLELAGTQADRDGDILIPRCSYRSSWFCLPIFT